MSAADAKPAEAIRSWRDVRISELSSLDADLVARLRSGTASAADWMPFGPMAISGFVERLKYDIWCIPTLISTERGPIGFVVNVLNDHLNLTSRIVAGFEPDSKASLGLILAVRSLFWALPVSRVYSYWPVTGAGAQDIASIFLGAGFREEGRLEGHQLVGGIRHDVVVHGILREDFNLWCRDNAPELALP